VSGRRAQLRSGGLSDAATSAKSLNEVLANLYQRIEALERVKFIDVEVVTDAAGVASGISIAKQPWPVKAVYLARFWDATTGIAGTAGLINWTTGPTGTSVTLYAGSVSPSRTYDVRLELRG
jgi:hypothetical protein